jgi:deoxyribose-phosphate aldolase
VKTSTGFAVGGATAADVRLLKASVGGRAKVKASGGIRDWHSAREMLEAGADRIGTRASLKIVEEWSAATVKR